MNVVVDRAIAHTRQLLESCRVDWATARTGLEKIRDRLTRAAGESREIDRLRAFIVEQDRLRRDP